MRSRSDGEEGTAHQEQGQRAAIEEEDERPRPDAIYPGATEAFLHECEEQGVNVDDVRVILWDGPLAFYNLEERFREAQAGT